MNRPEINIEVLQAESRARHNQTSKPKAVVIKKRVKAVKVVERVKIVEKPIIPDREIISFIKKAMHVAGVIQSILNRIEEERAMAKMKQVLPPKKVPKRGTSKPTKGKPAKKLVFNPKAHTGMVDWDKIRHF